MPEAIPPLEPESESLPNIEVRLSDDNGEILTDNGFHSIGSFIRGVSTYVTIWVGNTGETGSVLVIPQNGIYIEEGGSASIESNPSSAGPVSIIQGLDDITFVIKVDTNVVGNKSFGLVIFSSDEDIPKFNHNFFFSVTEPSLQNPDIAIVYDGSQIQANSVVSLGLYPKEGVANISFQIFNYAVPPLVIPQNGITITTIGNDEMLVTDPSDSGELSLDFNESVTFVVGLDTTGLGDKSVVVLITSNDSDENPFVFTISYTIAKAFDLFVQESSEEVESDETVNLGSFNKKTIINKNISISNKGISYGIRLLSISSDGDISLLGVPSLPFVLQPNERSIAEFVARFGSATLGRKNASLRIQWEVSA